MKRLAKDKLQKVYITVKRLTSSLISDNPDLTEWAKCYAEYHVDRIVDDIMLILEACEEKVGLHIADIGSTPPLVPAYLAENGHQVDALDIDPSRVRVTAESSFTLHTTDNEDITNSRLPRRDYDIIVLTEVLEHLRINIPVTLSTLNNSLVNGGVLVLSTPNLWSYRGIRSLLIDQRAEVLCSRPEVEYKKLDELGHMGHVREYTYKEVASLLRSCGFRIKKVVFRQYQGPKTSCLEKVITKLVPRLRNNVAILAIKDKSS